MGWCRQGADSLAHIRIYWKNDGDMLELIKGIVCLLKPPSKVTLSELKGDLYIRLGSC